MKIEILYIFSIILLLLILFNYKNRGFKNIKKVDKMDGFTFEKYMHSFLNKYDIISCVKTPGTGDFGADLLSKNAIFQLKNYTGKVPKKVIKEMIRAKEHYKKRYMVLITNSFVSNPTKELAIKYKIILIERVQLIQLFQTRKKIQNLKKIK